jgi:hypothetical protein
MGWAAHLNLCPQAVASANRVTSASPGAECPRLRNLSLCCTSRGRDPHLRDVLHGLQVRLKLLCAAHSSLQYCVQTACSSDQVIYCMPLGRMSQGSATAGILVAERYDAADSRQFRAARSAYEHMAVGLASGDTVCACVQG